MQSTINDKYGIITTKAFGYLDFKKNENTGMFYKNNKFIILDNKIFDYGNHFYIKVKLIINDPHCENIDFELLNEEVFINITKTNLWKPNKVYLEYIQSIQKFKQKLNNKWISGVFRHYPKGTLIDRFHKPVRLGISYVNNDYRYSGYLTKNDIIYLICPQMDELSKHDRICIYAERLNRMGWIFRNHIRIFIENSGLDFMLNFLDL